MEVLFLKLLDMSIAASWLVLAIMAVRFLFRRIPKWISCLLWALVALRLLCPFSIESTFSLVPDTEFQESAISEVQSNRIHTTDYNEMAPEEFREKIQLLFENGQWVLKLPSGEESPVNDALDFSKFVW